MAYDLNIICFDVPFPADYGGAIEEFYKLKSLFESGVKIHLHCFVYGSRKPQAELEKYCEEVFYYERNRSVKDIFSNLPFIVKTRMKDELLKNLLANDYPVLFDATHSTGFLQHAALKGRKKIVRLHNIEWIYYSTLFHSAYRLKERIFYFLEYKKLRKYDSQLRAADLLLCLSRTDHEYYSEKFHSIKNELVHVFHENETITCKPGRGEYLLYHGNLSVLDNYMAVIDLLNNTLKDCKYPVVIAGKAPSVTLVKYLKNKKNITLIPDPSQEKLDELIGNAQICLAIASNPSGIKLKLINSMYRGRFIFSNESAFVGSGLEECVINIDENREVPFSALVEEYMHKEFTQEDINKRSMILSEKYDNKKNGERIIQFIFKK